MEKLNLKSNIVLGIETSCDETAIALYSSSDGLLSHCLYSQIESHKKYGGVMPEVASRDHIKRVVPLIKQAVEEANLSLDDIGVIAYTSGPGLVGALMVGASIARSLAYALDIPAIPINHMEGHLLAPMLDKPAPEFPFVSLLISGGHTQLIEVKKIGSYNIIGESVDDAVGEAFDKTARLLGLSYPGGPELSKLAESGELGKYVFPRPMTRLPGLNFSFSGLKTHAMTAWKKCPQSEQDKADISLAFEIAVAKTLAIKCKRALDQTGLKTIVVAGGVSANVRIRQELRKLANDLKVNIFFPRHEFCTDNGAMIAYAGSHNIDNIQNDLLIRTQAKWRLS